MSQPETSPAVDTRVVWRVLVLVFAAIAWHLAHPPAARDAAAANCARWQETVRSGRARCEHGIDGHEAA